METFGDFIVAIKDKVEEIGIKLIPNHYSETVMNWQAEVDINFQERTGYSMHVRD